MCLVADRVRNKCDASKQAEEGSLRLATPVAHSTGTRLLACVLQISGYSGKPSWQVAQWISVTGGAGRLPRRILRGNQRMKHISGCRWLQCLCRWQGDIAEVLQRKLFRHCAGVRRGARSSCRRAAGVSMHPGVFFSIGLPRHAKLPDVR